MQKARRKPPERNSDRKPTNSNYPLIKKKPEQLTLSKGAGILAIWIIKEADLEAT